jgi:hypothetical protein
MPSPVVVSIHIAMVASGRRSEGRSSLDLSRWSIGSMIRQAAIVLAERSIIEPVCRARLSKLRQGLTHLSPEVVTWLDRPRRGTPIKGASGGSMYLRVVVTRRTSALLTSGCATDRSRSCVRTRRTAIALSVSGVMHAPSYPNRSSMA